MKQTRDKTLRWPLLLTSSMLLVSLPVSPAVPAGGEEPPPERRFEFQVRELVFQGLAGDLDALSEALRLCEEALVADPDHAEALVWHGSATLLKAGAAYGQGNFTAGATLWDQGIAEMARAVEIAPDDVAVLIPRAAALLGASRGVPFPAQARELARTAVADYEKVYELQRPYFSSLSEHARGELLLGIADGYQRLRQSADVERYMGLVNQELPGTGYAQQAQTYLAADPAVRTLPVRTCHGCHGEGE